MQAKDRILVLSVDRDNDIGEKTSLHGPLIGKKEVIKAAVELGVADPEESDTNALFQAVKLYEELRGKQNVEVALITGDKSVGVKSDKRLLEQLDAVLKRFDADFVVFVSDGSQDEHVMPIIQSVVPILSVKRVVVRQSERLESSYYKLKDFIEESLEKPKVSRLIFGVPGIILILLAIFGAEGWILIIGVTGFYLFFRGFKFDDYIISGVHELVESFRRNRFAFFMYIVAMVLFALASFRGYEIIPQWINIGLFEAIAAFVSVSIYFYFAAGASAWIGKSLNPERNRTRKKIVSIPLFGFAVSVVIYSATQLILISDLPVMNFVISVLFGFALLFVALLLEWK